MEKCFCMEIFQAFDQRVKLEDRYKLAKGYVCDSCVKNILESKNELVRENERLKEQLRNRV